MLKCDNLLNVIYFDKISKIYLQNWGCKEFCLQHKLWGFYFVWKLFKVLYNFGGLIRATVA